MAAAHSKLTNGIILVLAGACFATTIALVYLLRRPASGELVEEVRQVYSSKHTIVEVPVPSDIVGAVIGRYGSNIDQIQKATSTKINFKDNMQDDGTRVAVIRGKPNDVYAAEKLLRTTVVERMNVLTEEITIPTKACGAVIGKSGSNIRMICETSKAKVNIDSSSRSGSSTQKVTIRGTSSEILSAKLLIEEKVAEVEEKESKTIQLSMANRQPQYDRPLLLCDAPAKSERKSAPAVEELVPTGQDGFLEIFVSSVQSPDQFWVQPVGVNFSTELDKLLDKMTDFYESSNDEEESLLLEVKVGDIVASKFSNDGKWYRATVCSVFEDDYDPRKSEVQIFYADFGDYETTTLGELKPLEPDFLSLPFQAVECRLSGVVPAEGKWSEDAVKCFEDKTYCCHWKPLMLRVVDKPSKSDEESSCLTVELVDTGSNNVDISIAQALTRDGFARLLS